MSNLENNLLQNSVDLEIENIAEDVRGKNVFLSFGDLRIVFVETNKGYSRGGHYHKKDTNHNLLSGKIHLRQKNVQTGEEIEKIFVGPTKIPIPGFCAHLLTALTDTKLVEAFGNGYEDTVYPEYREIVERRMKK